MMTKTRKREVRRLFREAVFQRDNHTCQVCGASVTPGLADPGVQMINAHHIWPREKMPSGGYVVENGITVCDTKLAEGRKSCHEKVEEALADFIGPKVCGPEHYDLHPDKLYQKIGSSHEAAYEAALKLA